MKTIKNAIIINTADNRFCLRAYRIKKKTIGLLTNFCPSAYPTFTDFIDKSGKCSVDEFTNYSETNMGFYVISICEDVRLNEMLEFLGNEALEQLELASISPISHIGTKR